MNRVRIAISLCLLAGAAWAVSRETDWNLVDAAFTRISLGTFALTMAALVAGALLATLRLQWIAHDLGYKLSFRDAMAGFTYGHVMGVLFFQLAGQLLARSTVLLRRQVPPSATIVITGYERLAALLISLLLATIAAIYLFGAISLDYRQGGSSFIKIALGVVLVLAGGAIFVWGELLGRQLPRLTPQMALALFRNALISLGIQLFTMTAYVLLAHALAPSISITKLAAASALVMLAASLPISLAGWGIREMSAIYVLGTLGISTEVAFMIAISVGALSLAVVGALALIGLRDSTTPAAPHQPSSRSMNYSALIDTALPIGAATAVFFQLYLPVRSGIISVNMADPIVLLAGCIFIYNHFRVGLPKWRLPYFNLLIFIASAALLAAYLHGYFEFGWTQWATANKLVGWPILLCYGATGALIAYRSHNLGLDLLLRTFVVTSLVIFLFDYTLSIAFWSGIHSLEPLIELPIQGFSQNRNAFAFQLLLSICIVLASRWPHKAIWLGIAVAGVFVTGSRAGYLASALILVVAILVAPINWREGAVAAALASITVLVSQLTPEITYFVEMTSHIKPAAAPAIYMARMISSESSDAERMTSLIGGWQLFANHPVFGAGLGAFMEQNIRHGGALVIHSTPLWLLAEFGALGFIAMTTPIVLIFRSEIIKWPHLDDAGRLLILTITAFAAMSLFHELLYQRAFWLLLGAAMAVPRANNRTSRRPEHI